MFKGKGPDFKECEKCGMMYSYFGGMGEKPCDCDDD